MDILILFTITNFLNENGSRTDKEKLRFFQKAFTQVTVEEDSKETAHFCLRKYILEYKRSIFAAWKLCSYELFTTFFSLLGWIYLQITLFKSGFQDLRKFGGGQKKLMMSLMVLFFLIVFNHWKYLHKIIQNYLLSDTPEEKGSNPHLPLLQSNVSQTIISYGYSMITIISKEKTC